MPPLQTMSLLEVCDTVTRSLVSRSAKLSTPLSVSVGVPLPSVTMTGVLAIGQRRLVVGAEYRNRQRRLSCRRSICHRVGEEIVFYRLTLTQRLNCRVVCVHHVIVRTVRPDLQRAVEAVDLRKAARRGGPRGDQKGLVSVHNSGDRQRPNPSRPRADHIIVGQHVTNCAGVRVRDYGVRVRNRLR